MAINHGVFVKEQDTSVSTPVTAAVSVPFVIGCAPVQAASAPATVGVPVLCTSWDEFVEKFGYSDDWKLYNLCEFAYSHFKLYGCQPAIFCNLMDVDKMRVTGMSAKVAVVNHRATLALEAILDTVVVKVEGGESALVLDTDYSVYIDDSKIVIELIKTSAHYGATALEVTYDEALPMEVTAELVASQMDAVELCMSTAAIVPDLIVAPGYSKDNTVAAIMATKAAAVNGLFSAKALIDIDAAKCTRYTDAISYKTENNLVNEEQILCWPMHKLGDKQFHMSTQLAGLMASVDAEHENPYESPSNKNFQMDSLCLADGTPVMQTKAQADMLNANGIVTALNFLASGWVCWGNYTACYPAITDVKDYFIPVSRMFGWIGNTMIQTFWSKLDQPMNRRLLDNIVDSCNIWLNGLTGSGYLLGGRAEVLNSENPVTDLMAGIIRIHLYITPPSPAQEIDFVLEYDVNYVQSALA